MNHFVKIAGMFALSAVTVAGVSLVTTDARAAEEEEDIALNADNESVDADAEEGTTGESEEAIIYPGGYYGWRGYAPFYRGYRPYYGGYRPYYGGYRPYYRPFYRGYPYYMPYRPFYRGYGYRPYGYGW